MRKIGCSIYIPFLCFLHIGTGKGIHVSRCCGYNWLAHYGRGRRSKGRSEKNIMGIWGHYDPTGRCVGFTRRRLLVARHFDGNSNPAGFSLSLGILLVHFFKKGRSSKTR